MKPSPADWARALPLLDEALALPAGEHQAWLAGQPPELRPLLTQLLAQRAALEADGFMQTPPELPGAQGHDDGFTAGQRVGPYELRRPLGRGGMASVWLAVRADGAHEREVALKMPCLDGGARVRLAAGFARECRILSRLTHPHIASVLDAGQDGGQPWLALEYVDGLPITEHCRARALSLQARLTLMVQVLRALQHAHGHLVIHRDLKPSNVMVGDAAQVKLLDFGIAKLLQGGEDSAPAPTLWGGRVMTPDYAAPEQINGRDVGTAADVYAAGALLFELLTGRRAHRAARATPAALEEAILHDDVPRASRIAATDPDAGLPGMTAQTLARRLRGDLDVIVRKALHKDPALRYASAGAMADDIERHLQQRPVLAQPDSALYTLRRFAARHRAGVTAAGLALVVLVGGSAALAWQGRQARLAGERAQAAMAFLAGLFDNSARLGSGAKPPHQVTGKELLEQGARRLLTEHTERNALRLELLEMLGRMSSDMDLLDLAAPMQQEAVDLSAELFGRGSLRHAQALLARAETTVRRGDFVVALQEGEQALRALDRHRDTEPEPWAQAQVLLGNVLEQRGREAESRAHLQAALALLRATDSRSETRSRAAFYLARADEARRDLAAAEALYIDGLDAARRNFGANSYIAAFGEENYGDLLRQRGRLADAREHLQRALQAYTTVLGPKHLSGAGVRFNLGQVQAAEGERMQADQSYAEAVALSDEVAGPFHPNYGSFFVVERATLLLDMGRLAEARALYDAWLAHWPPGSEGRGHAIRWVGLNYSRLLIQAHETARAAALLDEADASLATLPADLPRAQIMRMQARARRAELAAATGHAGEAGASLVGAMSAPGGDFSGALALLGALAAQRPPAALAQQALDAYAALGDSTAWAAMDVERQARQALALSRLHRAAGHAELARREALQAAELRGRIDAPDSPWLAQARQAL